MLFATIAFVSQILPFCYLSSRTTSCLVSIGHHAYTSSWYSMPVNQQKCIRMIISYGQIERRYSGYHLIDSSMISFLKVIHIHESNLRSNQITQLPFDFNSRSSRRQYPTIYYSNKYLRVEIRSLIFNLNRCCTNDSPFTCRAKRVSETSNTRTNSEINSKIRKRIEIRNKVHFIVLNRIRFTFYWLTRCDFD